jgi:hypothetical protein
MSGSQQENLENPKNASQSSTSHCILASVKCDRTDPRTRFCGSLGVYKRLPSRLSALHLQLSIFVRPSHLSPPNRQVYHIRLSQEAMRRSNKPFVETAVRFLSILLSSFLRAMGQGLLSPLIRWITIYHVSTLLGYYVFIWGVWKVGTRP